MSHRTLPKLTATALPGMRTEILPSALSRWNPSVRAAAQTDEEVNIAILDVIGKDWSGEGVTSAALADALDAAGNRDVIVTINSPGGNYFEGLSIYNMLLEYPAKVTVKILGLAASAASVIAMAGDEIRIARAGFLMIHNTWVVAMGDQHAFRNVADWLAPFDASAVDVYAARTGVSAEKIAAMLDRETWIGGASAVEQGFADGLLGGNEVATGAKASGERHPLVAAHKIDTLLAKAGVSRSERRELLAAVKGGMPGAAATGMQDAAVIAEVSGLLDEIRKI